jgi:hypothetical protein
MNSRLGGWVRFLRDVRPERLRPREGAGAPSSGRFDVSTWDTLIPHELVQWLPLILIALLIIYAMFRSSRRPREPAPPQRFSFGRMLLVALFLAGLAFLVTWGR